MSNIEKLRAWTEAEKAKGLVDVKFFPSDNVVKALFGLPHEPSKELSEEELEKAAGDVLAMLVAAGEGEDISNVDL